MLGADQIVIDLEDAVIPDAKDAARARVVSALETGTFGASDVAVRVNAPGTPWCHADLVALAGALRPPDSIVLPKVGSTGDLAFADRLLAGVERAAGRERPLRIQALIENAAGLGRVGQIAGSSSRLDGLILGYADLAASLGRSASGARELDSWRAAQEAVLVAARATGQPAIDGPYLGIAVDEPFVAAATRAREIGFDGKWALHPSQVSTLNRIFTPTEAELERARAVIAALDEAERDGGRGAVALDGEMLDEAVRAAALRTLARGAVAT